MCVNTWFVPYGLPLFVVFGPSFFSLLAQVLYGLSCIILSPHIPLFFVLSSRMILEMDYEWKRGLQWTRWFLGFGKATNEKGISVLRLRVCFIIHVILHTASFPKNPEEKEFHFLILFLSPRVFFSLSSFMFFPNFSQRKEYDLNINKAENFVVYFLLHFSFFFTFSFPKKSKIYDQTIAYSKVFLSSPSPYVITQEEGVRQRLCKPCMRRNELHFLAKFTQFFFSL